MERGHSSLAWDHFHYNDRVEKINVLDRGYIKRPSNPGEIQADEVPDNSVIIGMEGGKKECVIAYMNSLWVAVDKRGATVRIPLLSAVIDAIDKMSSYRDLEFYVLD